MSCFLDLTTTFVIAVARGIGFDGAKGEEDGPERGADGGPEETQVIGP